MGKTGKEKKTLEGGTNKKHIIREKIEAWRHNYNKW